MKTQTGESLLQMTGNWHTVGIQQMSAEMNTQQSNRVTWLSPWLHCAAQLLGIWQQAGCFLDTCDFPKAKYLGEGVGYRQGNFLGTMSAWKPLLSCPYRWLATSTCHVLAKGTSSGMRTLCGIHGPLLCCPGT